MTQHVIRMTKPWENAERAKAAELWQRNFVDVYGDDEDAPTGARMRVLAQIGRALGRSYSSVDGCLKSFGPSFGASRRGTGPSAFALAQRDARREAANTASLTAIAFGDPPPGFSMLDRRR